MMIPFLETSGLTVELPTPAGWVWPVNEVSLLALFVFLISKLRSLLNAKRPLLRYNPL
jgi:hypothetical protein